MRIRNNKERRSWCLQPFLRIIKWTFIITMGVPIDQLDKPRAKCPWLDTQRSQSLRKSASLKHDCAFVRQSLHDSPSGRWDEERTQAVMCYQRLKGSSSSALVCVIQLANSIATSRIIFEYEPSRYSSQSGLESGLAPRFDFIGSPRSWALDVIARKIGMSKIGWNDEEMSRRSVCAISTRALCLCECIHVIYISLGSSRRTENSRLVRFFLYN